MSDDRELSEEQERVRRLLAQARVDEPMPGDVVERLDRVLARLADEDSPSKVVELTSRRRRKASTLLVAAAAVVAVGIGAGALLPGSLDSGSDDAGGSSLEADDAPDAAADRNELADGPDQAAPEADLSGSALSVPRRIRPDHFAEDVARLHVIQSADGGAAAAEDAPQDGFPPDSRITRRGFMCDPAPWGAGRLVAVRYAGTPAVLAFRPPAGESQVVDLLECGTAAILRSVTLPAR